MPFLEFSKERVVCELSGGADSALVAALLKEAGREVFPIFVNYGQPYEWHEYAKSLLLSKKLGLHDLYVVDCQLRTGHVENCGAEYVPFRNLVLSAIAVNYAQSIDAVAVYSGSKGLTKVPDDPYSFKDSTAPFYVLVQAVVNYANESRRGIEVVPLLATGRDRKLLKSEVYDLLERKYGIIKSDTWSCFNPQGDLECRTMCNNCREKYSTV